MSATTTTPEAASGAADVLEAHPLAALFPMMRPADLSALAQNIREEGLKAPITLYEGKILDGRNRYRACQIAGVAPKTREFAAGSDPLAFVLAANLHRRHLTTSQRAMVAAKIARLTHGGNRKDQAANLPLDPTIGAVARQLSVSPRAVREARIVARDPGQRRAVEAGKKTVHAAAREIKAAQSEAAEPPCDTTGYPIPPELWPLWRRKPEVENLLKLISQARSAIRAAAENDDLLYRPANLNSVLSRLNQAYTETRLAIPYAVCVTCQGRAAEVCASCKGRGFLSQHHFDHCVPQELKAIRAAART